ncbi:MAG: hypothetical protein ACE5I3_03485 [Phycisphaerae bacterium]
MPRCLAAVFCRLPLFFVCAASAASAARADEVAILADIKAFYETSDATLRAEMARRIETDPDYDRARVSGWLHQATLFRPLKPGRTQIRVPIDDGRTLAVTLRIPSAYDHRRPYPLLYVLHGTGGSGDGIIGYVEQVLGDDMIDWDQLVSLKVNGRKAFEGKLEPDLFVCLTQAVRTYDFERLRWTGLRFKSGSRTKIVTGHTPFPTPPITPR